MKKKSYLLTAVLAMLLLFVVLLPRPTLAATPVRPTDHELSSSYSLMGLRGEFFRSDYKAALDRMNAIRKEACNNGYADPRNPSRKLTPSDYRPLKWSNGLEYIAQTRAAEATWMQDHARPDDTYCFDAVSPEGVRTWAENLAWYTAARSSITQVAGIEGWYAEKKYYLEDPNSPYAGHYTTIINPYYTYVGVGCFASDALSYYGQLVPAVAAEYSAYADNTPSHAVSGKYIQAIPVANQSLSVSVTGPAMVEKGLTGQFKVSVKTQVPSDIMGIGRPSYVPTVLDQPTWKTGKAATATVDRNGKVTGVATGQVKITASYGSSSASTVTCVTTRPRLNAAINTRDGVVVRFHPIAYATNYCIYRKEGNSWKKLAELPKNSPKLVPYDNKLMYTDTEVKNNYGKACLYTVLAKVKGCGTTYDKKGIATYRLAPPTIKSARSNKTGTITVTWSSANCQGYALEYCVRGTSNWTKCSQTKNTSQTVTGLKKGTAYTFRVRCYKSNSSRGTFYSYYSTNLSAIAK